MENQNTPAPDVTVELLKRLEALEAGHSALQKENAALRKGIKTAETPDVKQKPVIPTETFEVDGKTYKFIAPAFRLGDQDMTAQDALAEPALLEALVDNRSGIITEVIA